jgi:hypothetical protein
MHTPLMNRSNDAQVAPRTNGQQTEILIFG